MVSVCVATCLNLVIASCLITPLCSLILVIPLPTQILFIGVVFRYLPVLVVSFNFNSLNWKLNECTDQINHFEMYGFNSWFTSMLKSSAESSLKLLVLLSSESDSCHCSWIIIIHSLIFIKLNIFQLNSIYACKFNWCKLFRIKLIYNYSYSRWY